MKKPSASKKSLTTAKTKPDSLSGLLTEVRQLIQSARRGVATVVDTFQVMTNFEIGRRIVEHEQKGAKRAAYGAELLKELSARLTEEFGRGFSPVNLSHMRRFFLTWQDRAQIFQSASEKLGGPGIVQTLSEKSTASEISQTLSGKLVPNSIRQTLSGKSPFTLSWSHYVVLMTIKDPDERSFYEIESRQADWDVRELKRQKASCLYERLALSRDKEGIRKLAKEGQVIVRPEDLLKEPLVLEFLGMEEHSYYYDREVKLPEENPTIGLLLCKSAKKTVVGLTLPNVRQHHAKEPQHSGDRQPQAARKVSAARQYLLYLPSKELLKQKLDEWSAIEPGNTHLAKRTASTESSSMKITEDDLKNAAEQSRVEVYRPA